MTSTTDPTAWPDYPDTDDDAPRTPTHLAPVADERAVLGACMASPRALDAVVPHIPSGGVFWEARHGSVWDAIRRVWDAGHTADALNVHAELDRAGDSSRVGGRAYLHTLLACAETGTLADPAPYVGRVLDGWELRGGDEALVRGRQVIASPGGGDPGAILDAVAAEVTRARDRRTRAETVVRVGDLVDPVLESLIAYDFEEDGAGVPLPWRDVATVVNPMMPGQVLCFGGRPGMGKSTALKDAVEYPAFALGLTTLLVSYEMRGPEIAARVMSSQSRVPLAHLTRPGQLTDSDRARIEDYRAALAAAPLLIVDTEDTSLAELDRLIREHRPRLVAVDYLQLAVGDGPDDSRRARVERYSRDVKKMAGRREVPVIIGSQLNRANETRRDKTPHLADLRESGAIEQDCDVVILLHRDDYYEPESVRAGEADFIIAKQRNGPLDTVALAARFHFARFSDMA